MEQGLTDMSWVKNRWRPHRRPGDDPQVDAEGPRDSTPGAFL